MENPVEKNLSESRAKWPRAENKRRRKKNPENNFIWIIGIPDRENKKTVGKALTRSFTKLSQNWSSWVFRLQNLTECVPAGPKKDPHSKTLLWHFRHWRQEKILQISKKESLIQRIKNQNVFCLLSSNTIRQKAMVKWPQNSEGKLFLT